MLGLKLTLSPLKRQDGGGAGGLRGSLLAVWLVLFDFFSLGSVWCFDSTYDIYIVLKCE